ncbi:hypothetical protein A33Q_1730 [Indibacter alkaliphilus LW1]|jgi:hypothetical protein|uniref:Uncharacterized protein n=1 Tax=Indibacter alkaliphilus (strain CCUG 57479 / KCTC 22604 / LW1) TaxID=1189612 RepID=S2DYI5_INDAL|nr:hypothetical protein [Indibacter alkaliphilus]EOZ97191.1 hypothetical protein A33Q_1730 [Indibacter alkaliphilus LW1]
MGNYVFKETQQFKQPWIWGIVLVASGIIFFGLFSQPIKDWEMAIPIIILALVILLLAKMQLKTRIDNSTLTFSFFPLIRKRTYKLSEIEKLELIKYNSIFNFGGWGIRYNFSMWGYNVAGNQGLIVSLKDKKFLIGTQKPEEMQKAIKQFEELKSAYNAR